MKRLNRLPKSELPGLPKRWVWVNATTCGTPCWEADSDTLGVVILGGPSSPEVHSDAGTPPEVVALVEYANGLGPDPRVPTKVAPMQADRFRLVVGLDLLREAVEADPKIDARVRAALVLLEEA